MAHILAPSKPMGAVQFIQQSRKKNPCSGRAVTGLETSTLQHCWGRGWGEMGARAMGRLWGGPGRVGRDLSALRTVTHTLSPCLSPEDYKNGIENMIFCLCHRISSARPYFQDMRERRGLWRILQWCYLTTSIFFTKWSLFKLLHFIDAPSQFYSCLNPLFHVSRCFLSSFWLDCLIHYSDSSN